MDSKKTFQYHDFVNIFKSRPKSPVTAIFGLKITKKITMKTDWMGILIWHLYMFPVKLD